MKDERRTMLAIVHVTVEEAPRGCSLRRRDARALGYPTERAQLLVDALAQAYTLRGRFHSPHFDW